MGFLYQLELSSRHWHTFNKCATSPCCVNLTIPFSLNDAAFHFDCKHSVFIEICASWQSIFSNKVDLSQVTSVLIYTISVSWNLCKRLFYVIRFVMTWRIRWIKLYDTYQVLKGASLIWFNDNCTNILWSSFLYKRIM